MLLGITTAAQVGADTVLVSAALRPGIGGNDAVLPVPAPSADGRYVAFTSRASNLVADPPHPLDEDADIFVRDLVAGTTVLVSVPMAGSPFADAGSFSPEIAGNGRRVVFRSAATNLDAIRPPGAYSGIYVRDLDAGSTVLVNAGVGWTAPNAASGSTAIAAGGRYVAFASSASNLVANDPNGSIRDIFVHDLDSGTTELITPGANLGSSGVAISADGRYLAFESEASNLTLDPNGHRADIFVHDRQTGSTERVSVAVDDSVGANGSCQDSLDISDDGRFVVFACLASNLVAGDDNGVRDVFLRDRQEQTTVMISRRLDGAGGGDDESSNPRLSGDGRRIVFHSRASNLVADDANAGTLDVFMHDRTTGVTGLVSRSADGLGGGNDISQFANISGDGRFAVFSANASNLVQADLNGTIADIFRAPLDDILFADGFEE